MVIANQMENVVDDKQQKKGSCDICENIKGSEELEKMWKVVQ